MMRNVMREDVYGVEVATTISLPVLESYIAGTAKNQIK